MAFYNWIISTLQTGQEEIFSKATIDASIVLAAFFLLIVSGVLSGIFPAQKAVKIMPVEALNRID